MDCIITRNEATEAGIFGVLTDSSLNAIGATLEHAYDSGHGDGSYVPKVPPGVYKCVKHPPNRLPYTTYELQGVPDFKNSSVTGILIHCGNFDKDSEGCILLGTSRQGDMVVSSKAAFAHFMMLQSDAESFTLTIKDEK